MRHDPFAWVLAAVLATVVGGFGVLTVAAHLQHQTFRENCRQAGATATETLTGWEATTLCLTDDGRVLIP